jgi:hypothetical protein
MRPGTTPKRTCTRTLNNTTTTGVCIPDKQDAAPEPSLSSRPMNIYWFGSGRPQVSDHWCADSIVFALRTGSHRALNNTGLCATPTAGDQFRAWIAAGVFLNPWQVRIEPSDKQTGIDRAWPGADGAMTTWRKNPNFAPFLTSLVA